MYIFGFQDLAVYYVVMCRRFGVYYEPKLLCDVAVRCNESR